MVITMECSVVIYVTEIVIAPKGDTIVISANLMFVDLVQAVTGLPAIQLVHVVMDIL